MKLIKEGRISLIFFLLSIITPAGLFPLRSFSRFTHLEFGAIILCGSFFLYSFFSFVCTKSPLGSVAIRASFLGTIFAGGVFLSIFAVRKLSIFGWYVCFLSFFHYSEYLTIAIANPKSLSLSSFMLSHSVAYAVAACASWMEFFIEYYLFPEVKETTLVSVCGVVLCVAGELLRKTAIVTASTSFNHIVQTKRDSDHVLVTHGVYSWCRHPSYVGWFYWSIGTQLILLNPVGLVIYAYASWKFFKDRVFIEEVTLLDFFGDEYVQYKKKVPTGLPFNDGVPLSE